MRTLIGVFDCRETLLGNYYRTTTRLLYTLTFEDRTSLLSDLVEVNNTLVAEWFREGINSLNISVCRYLTSTSRFTCNPTSIPMMIHLNNLEILVLHNTSRLFPYGSLTRDPSFYSVTDGVVETYPSEEIQWLLPKPSCKKCYLCAILIKHEPLEKHKMPIYIILYLKNSNG